jgi:hypothetical protein
MRKKARRIYKKAKEVFIKSSLPFCEKLLTFLEKAKEHLPDGFLSTGMIHTAA